MSSQIYILKDEESLLKVKKAIFDKLKSVDAVKFNGDYTISIEGWDVLTFIHANMDDIASHIVPNAPYFDIHNINLTLVDKKRRDEINRVLEIGMHCYDDARKHNHHFDLNNNIIDEFIFFKLLYSTTHDYYSICNGRTTLEDDIKLYPHDIERLVKICNENDEFQDVKTTVHVFDDLYTLQASMHMLQCILMDHDIEIIEDHSIIDKDNNMMHRFIMLDERLHNRIGIYDVKRIHFHYINESDIPENVMKRLKYESYDLVYT